MSDVIHWYPGHMNKTRRDIAEAMPVTDVVIEVLDARLPSASSNPMLAEMRRANPDRVVPCIKLLNKKDLADPEATAEWKKHFEREDGVAALPISANLPGCARAIIEECHRLGAKRLEKSRTVRVMIQGIPNTGKSTLLNTLKGKKVTQTGNEPGVTKQLQRVDIGGGVIVHDTPGMMWPKIDDQKVGWLLAMSGAIRDTAVDAGDVGLYAVRWLRENHPDALMKRYAIEKLPDDALAILVAIGAKRGCLSPGGEVNHRKAADMLLFELRGGKLGRISFEWPD